MMTAKRKPRIVLVVGARPNFMKAAPLMEQLRRESGNFDTILIHTGQHYDHNLSQLFFEQLNMPQPDSYLGVGSGTHAQQTAKIMTRLEEELMRIEPDLVVVFGDVNSTLAAAVVSGKLCIKLGHVEAGLRSFDNTMPEEINRIVTDRLSDYLFVSENAGLVNLRQEGVAEEKIFYVGNIMIDSLVSHIEVARQSSVLEQLSLEPGSYALMTMHRPSNVDDAATLSKLMAGIAEIGERMPVVFPCHPRTVGRMKEFGISTAGRNANLRIEKPLGYLDFLQLQIHARLVLTDSGGIQEETTYLGVPCITMRDTTELLATIEEGTNQLCGTDTAKIISAVDEILDGNDKKGRIPELWDGQTSSRIVKVLLDKLL